MHDYFSINSPKPQLMTRYQYVKRRLKEVADRVKRQSPKDKPGIRTTINDTADMLVKDHELSERETQLLSNYACKLHPK